MRNRFARPPVGAPAGFLVALGVCRDRLGGLTAPLAPPRRRRVGGFRDLAAGAPAPAKKDLAASSCGQRGSSTLHHRLARWQSDVAPTPPTIGLGLCPNPQRRQRPKKAPRKWHDLASQSAGFGEYPEPVTAASRTPRRTLAAAGSKLAARPVRHITARKSPYGWSGYRPNPSRHAHSFPGRVASGIRIFALRCTGPSSCESFRGADGGQ